MFPEFTQFLPTVVHYENTPNNPIQHTSSKPVQFFLNFPHSGNCNQTMGNTERKTLNEPLRNITRTFFEEIQNSPTDYLIRTLWSHHWENCRCAEHFPAGNTAIKLARKILNLPAVYWVRLCSVNYPSPCSVLTVFLMGKPALAPSVWHFRGRCSNMRRRCRRALGHQWGVGWLGVGRLQGFGEGALGD